MAKKSGFAAAQVSTDYFRNFSGGINLRDVQTELGNNELPHALNVTIDERGGAEKRLGYVDRYGSLGSGVPRNLAFWATKNQEVNQIGADMRVGTNAPFLTWSTNDRCAITEINGSLAMAHPVDGVRLYDGVTVSTPTNSPIGGACATWQNKLWVAQKGSPRVWFSDIGDPTNFQTDSWIDFKEKDSDEITCLVGAAGQDISGRPGLLAYKAESAYRIFDSTTGEYNTIDVKTGTSSNIGAVSIYDRTYVVNPSGIWSTDGLSPHREDSQLINPLFNKDQINQNIPGIYCAGAFKDKIYFSLPAAGSSVNTLVVEIHPIQKWAMLHDNAASCYMTVPRGAVELVFGSPSSNLIFTGFRGGADNGSPIYSTMTTRWLEPYGGNKTRIRRMRFVGHGAFKATPLTDWRTTSALSSLNVNLKKDTTKWNSGVKWNSGAKWGPVGFNQTQDFQSIGVARAIAMKLEETSTDTDAVQQIVSSSIRPEKGAWSLSYIAMMNIQLGNV